MTGWWERLGQASIDGRRVAFPLGEPSSKTGGIVVRASSSERLALVVQLLRLLSLLLRRLLLILVVLRFAGAEEYTLNELSFRLLLLPWHLRLYRSL